MQNRLIIPLICLLSVFVNYSIYSQTGSGAIQGKVIDKEKKEGIPFCNVIISQNGSQKGGSATDFDGVYKISPLTPGKYDVEASYIGFGNKKITGVLVTSEKTTFINIDLISSDVRLQEVEIVEYEIPLIEKDKTSTGAVVTNEEIRQLPTRDVDAIVATSSGTFSRDEGDNVNIKGAREEGTVYYIDGIKVSSSSSGTSKAVPTSAISQMTVITGGVPASYGDAMGGDH